MNPLYAWRPARLVRYCTRHGRVSAFEGALGWRLLIDSEGSPRACTDDVRAEAGRHVRDPVGEFAEQPSPGVGKEVTRLPADRCRRFQAEPAGLRIGDWWEMLPGADEAFEKQASASASARRSRATGTARSRDQIV